MNAVFYTSKKTGDSFKLVFMTEDAELVDLLLDQLNVFVGRYITEEEFEAAHEEYMTMDVLDPDEINKIGEITCKKMDVSENGMIF